jgi:SAM-dependent methyltransferase
MFNFIKRFSAEIYDLFISTFFTIAAHLCFITEMTLSSGNFLDVGCGTGKPLKVIIRQIQAKHSKVVGVDLHPQYTDNAIQLFKGDPDV